MKIFSTITFCLLITAAFSHADLMDGLVLYMPLDEGSGTVTQDFSANGFEGELQGRREMDRRATRTSTPICSGCRSRPH